MVNADLTRRELEVLEKTAEYGLYSVVAHALGITGDTVKTHLEHIRGKMQVDTTVQAVYIATSRGIIPAAGTGEG